MTFQHGSRGSGELHFDLRGEKLAGRFVLIRRDRDRSGEEQWLLLHKDDDHARVRWDPEAHPASVLSGRTNDEVAAAPKALWRSGLPAGEASVPVCAPALPRWQAPTPEELAALDRLPGKGRWMLQGRQLNMTNLDKVLFPAGRGAAPVTKRDLIRYHAVIAPRLLPYVFDRPINLNRFPNGADRPGFWHKEVPGHAPTWLRRWRNEEAGPGETGWYSVVDSVPALAWMANFGALELHAWTSGLRDVHEPTWAQGLARLDDTQNAVNKTLVAPFSARPSEGAPVSVPIRWEELDDPDLRPDRWTISTVLERVDTHGDPLESLIGRPQELPALSRL